MDDLVSVSWLAANMGSADLVVLDASWHLDPKRDCRADYDKRHIPGARFAHLERDLSGAKTGKNGRHPLPDPATFAALMTRAGGEIMASG